MNLIKQFDYQRARADFPILSTEVKGKPLTYLDSAATSQKPFSVIEAIDRYYRLENSNIHRGVHYLSEQATDAYEITRAKVAKFIGASDPDEVIFVRGATEGINLIAHGFNSRPGRVSARDASTSSYRPGSRLRPARRTKPLRGSSSAFIAY